MPAASSAGAPSSTIRPSSTTSTRPNASVSPTSWVTHSSVASRHWWRDATLLCVTHDVGETLAFGRVLVVEDGRIVEDGAPAELAAGMTRYRALLEAEDKVRSGMWNGAHWRRIEVRGGQVLDG